MAGAGEDPQALKDSPPLSPATSRHECEDGRPERNHCGVYRELWLASAAFSKMCRLCQVSRTRD
jgi:hypothetical protein